MFWGRRVFLLTQVGVLEPLRHLQGKVQQDVLLPCEPVLLSGISHSESTRWKTVYVVGFVVMSEKPETKNSAKLTPLYGQALDVEGSSTITSNNQNTTPQYIVVSCSKRKCSIAPANIPESPNFN